MEKINKLLPKSTFKESTVNGSNKYINTVDSNKTVNEQIDEFIEDLNLPPDYVASKLAEDLDDKASIGYYKILAKENNAGRLFEALSYVKEAATQGKIRTKKAIYFQGILRHWGIKTKFSKGS